MLSALCEQVSSILSCPIIWDVFSVGGESIFIWRAIGIDFCGDIDNDRFLLTDAFPPMIDPTGYLNQQRVVNPDEEFIDLPFCWRALPRIIKD
jgi:hypothetical protein